MWFEEAGRSDSDCDDWDESDTEHKPKYTFEYVFPCIADRDINDAVRASFGELPSFMTLLELPDATCQYGTRWKTTCTDISADDIGRHPLEITLADSWDHLSPFTLQFVI